MCTSFINEIILVRFIQDGDLKSYLKRNTLNSNKIKDWFGQIVTAIKYLHTSSPPCLHRDLKPEYDYFLLFDNSFYK